MSHSGKILSCLPPLPTSLRREESLTSTSTTCARVSRRWSFNILTTCHVKEHSLPGFELVKFVFLSEIVSLKDKFDSHVPEPLLTAEFLTSIIC